MSNLKKCTKCGEVKGLSDFYRDKGGRDGLRASCRVCSVKRSADYASRNPDVRQRNDLRYKERHRERLRNAERERYHSFSEAEKQKHRQRGERWSRDNPEARLRIEIKRNLAVRVGIPYRDIPEDLVSAKVAQIKLTRLIRELKKPNYARS